MKLLIPILIGVFLLFALRSSILLDPDFGWHLKTGQLINSAHFPRIDPFSYTMSSFSYVDHAWLTDSIMSLMFAYVGMVGLGSSVSLIVIASIYISLRSCHYKNPGPFVVASAVILVAASIFPLVAIRPFVVSWLFFAITVWLTENSERWRKWRYVVPFIFLAWANLHGGFALGLVIIFLQGETLIFLLCLFATLINPYGLGLWREVWSTLSDSSLRWTIMEWRPIIYWFNPAAITLASLSIATLIRYRSKLNIRSLILFPLLLIFAITSARNVPYLVIFCLPLVILGLDFFSIQASSNKISRGRLRKASAFLLLFSLIILVIQIMPVSWTPLAYPKSAVEYLKENLPRGELFSTYDWGGYLIWHLPQKKTFVDGRMPSWRQPEGPKESPDAFKAYREIISGEKEFAPVFAKYGITSVLWPVSKGDKSKSFDFLTKLQTDGWHEVYKDNISVIYVSP